MTPKQETFAIAAFATIMANVDDSWLRHVWGLLAFVLWACCLAGVVLEGRRR